MTQAAKSRLTISYKIYDSAVAAGPAGPAAAGPMMRRIYKK